MNASLVEMLRKALEGKEGADIAIIGKGASVDAIDPKALEGMIVINANDSERVHPGDIGVFHHGWVLDYFELIPPTCRLYVTDRPMPEGVAVLPARYALPADGAEHFLSRFFDEDAIWLEQAAVISCLRVANELALSLGQRKRVFLLGFDFSMEHGFSAKVENGLHGTEDAYVDHLLKAQECYLEQLLAERDRLSMDVVHIGNRPYSLFSVEAFNALRVASLACVADDVFPVIERDAREQVLIVAEITTNHFGDRERLAAMVRLAKEAGADYVKLQKRDVESFYSREALEKPFRSPFGKTFREYRNGLELSEQDFVWLDRLCHKIGIGWFASVLDEPSYEFIKQFSPCLIKLPSTISNKKSYLQKVGAEWVGGLVVSTGMTGPDYENFIADSFSAASQLYLLQCTSAYPTPEADAGVGVVRHYRDMAKADPRIVPGYSSHDIGSLCSQLAVAAGARMIEKHVKLGSVQWAHFDDVALDLATGDFARFVADVRRAERIAGTESKVIYASEHHKY